MGLSTSVVNVCFVYIYYTMGHFIFRWNQSLKPWFETKYRFETKIKPKRLSFGFKPNLNSAVRFQTKRS